MCPATQGTHVYLSLQFSKRQKKVFTPKLDVEKLKDPRVRAKFLNGVKCELKVFVVSVEYI